MRCPLIVVLDVAAHLNLHNLLAMGWIISLFYWCYYIPAYFHVLVAFNNFSNLLALLLQFSLAVMEICIVIIQEEGTPFLKRQLQ